MSDGQSRDERPGGGGGGGLRLLRTLAIGAAAAGTVVAGQQLLDRRRRHASDGESRRGAKRESAKDRTEEGSERPADLATELRATAGELAVTLLDGAVDRLERAKP